VATILIISSIVKRLFWRASPLARGPDFYSGGRPPWPPTGAGAVYVCNQ